MTEKPKLAAAVNAQQYYIDTSPDKAWVLQDLDGECFLQKHLRKLKESGIFHRIYIMVGTGPEYKIYQDFGGEDIYVVQMDRNVYRDREIWSPKVYNSYNATEDTTLVWLYQLMLGFDEEYLFDTVAFGAFWDREQVQKGFEKLVNGEGEFAYLFGRLGLEGHIFKRSYFERLFQDGIEGRPRTGLEGANDGVVRVQSDRDVPSLYFECIRYFDCFLYTKQNFTFFKKFIQEHGGSLESSEFREDLIEYCKARYFQIRDSEPLVINVDVRQEDGSFCSVDDFQILLQRADEIGRLTIVLKHEFLKHPNLMEFLNIMNQYNLHYFLKTHGDFDSLLIPSLVQVINVFSFRLDYPTPEWMLKAEPTKKPQTIFKNFYEVLNRAKERGRVAVGVECQLPENDREKMDITRYWADRTDYIPPVWTDEERVQGHIQPCVQFVRYSRKGQFDQKVMEGIPLYELDISVPCYPNGKTLQEMSIREYCTQFGMSR